MIGDEDSVDVYMPWFLGDYWRDTGDLTCTEHGAYLQLLGRLWNAKGYLPFDAERLARLINLDPAQWERVWAAVRRFFTVADGRLFQKRVLYELEQARSKRQSAREKAQAAADARWRKQAKGKKQAKTRQNHHARSVMHPHCSSNALHLHLHRHLHRHPHRQDPEANPRSRAAPFDRVLATFKAAWKRRYGEEYFPTPGELSQLGRFLRTVPAEAHAALPACFERYLADESPFVTNEKRHSLLWFLPATA
jgi:uncharacterized protein YdaU (DUF1376 family)